MKAFLFTSILTVMCFFANAQKTVYDKDGNDKTFASEDLDIVFTKAATSAVAFPPERGAETAPLLAALLPTAVDIGLKAFGSALEKRVKKYTAEYTKQKSNLLAGNREVPEFQLVRQVTLENSSNVEEALVVKFAAAKVEGLQGFVYYVLSVNRKYSAAKVSSNHATLDYAIDLKVTLLVKGEKKVQELAPITITSVPFGLTDFSSGAKGVKHRSDIISLPEGGMLTEISMKVAETNPVKVRAERVLSIWNDQKDNVKTIINNFLPKAKEEKAAAEDQGTKNDNKSTGNRP